MNKIFPSDFFGPNLQEKNSQDKKKPKSVEPEQNYGKSKSIYVNLQNEIDEDRELLELLGGGEGSKSNFKNYLIPN